MSMLEDFTKRLRNRVEETRKAVRSTVTSLAESLPKPLRERRTIILREPLVKMLYERGKRFLGEE